MTPPRHLRRIIRITAEDSPNVALGLMQKAAGLAPTGEVIIPGVLPWHDYVFRRATWDAVRQSIGLDAQFWEGAEVLLYPAEWLNRAEGLWRERCGGLSARRAASVGIDPGEGGANTSMTAIDAGGILEMVSKKTPDTSVIFGEALAFAQKWSCPPERIVFDRGGGGKQIADMMERAGYPVATVGFGEPVSAPLRRKGVVPLAQRVDQAEDRYAYKNRRAEMYGLLRLLLDPADPLGNGGFALPPGSLGGQYVELRRQLSLLPLRYDLEGRMYLPPKNKPSPDSTVECLADILGRSPDEADSLVLAVFGMRSIRKKVKAGVL